MEGIWELFSTFLSSGTMFKMYFLVVFQLHSHVWLFCDSMDCPLSLNISWSLPKFISIASVMPSSHLILCHPFLLPSVFHIIRDFSNELAVYIRWPKYWNFSISPSSEYSGSLKLTGLISLPSKGFSGVFSSTTVQRHQFFGTLPSLWSSSHNHTWPLGRP